MANNVFANNNEVACKAGSGKTIAALPDTCFTPPECPATPPGVPIPYPNTGMTSDTTKGSKTVKISDKEVGLKNKSYFKTSYGDEAGCAAKKGIITSKNKGKVYFQSWSSDVKFEGKNAVRHLDMTTNNHASGPGDTPPWAYIDTGVFATDPDCADDKEEEKKACEGMSKKEACQEAGLNESQPNSNDQAVAKGYKSKVDFGNQAAKRAKGKNKAAKCIKARKCRLVPFKPNSGCCKSQTGDHLVPKSSFKTDAGESMPGWEDYDENAAPVMCLEGGSCSGSHGVRHTHHKSMAPKGHPKEPSFNKEVDHCVEGASFVAPHCNPDCLKKQIQAGHEDLGDRRKKVRHSSTGSPATPSQKGAMKRASGGATR